jgi:hypothetical protein
MAMDIAHYRRSEALAQQMMPSWRHAQAHRPHKFMAVGFPIQVESTADLCQLVDGMHDVPPGRFDGFQRELGGLSDSDFTCLVAALADYADFFAQNFGSATCPLPLASMLAHYLIFKKLLGWNPEFQELLEIGPGCGFLSFFLRVHPPLRRYAQIEVTESFYLLQHMVNRHCFGRRFTDHATLDPAVFRPLVLPAIAKPPGPNVSVTIPDEPICEHWPWWRAMDLVTRKFDIVTSNANLAEMTEPALQHYAKIIAAALRPEGALIAQDLGARGIDHKTIFDIFAVAGLVPLVFAGANTIPGRALALPNFILVHRERAPQWSSDQPWNLARFPANDAIAPRVFQLDQEPRAMRSPEQIGQAVFAQLGARSRRTSRGAIASIRDEMEQYGSASAGRLVDTSLAMETAARVLAEFGTAQPFLHFNTHLTQPQFWKVVAPLLSVVAGSDAFGQLRLALGGDICIIAEMSLVRIVTSAATSCPFHQDVNFTGSQYRIVNCWLPFRDCGGSVPGIEVLRRRFRVNLHTTRRGRTKKSLDPSHLYAMHYIGDSLDEILGVEAGQDSEFLGPRIDAGEAVLFDQYCLHRTQPMAGEFQRVGLELRIAALSDVMSNAPTARRLFDSHGVAVMSRQS